MRNITQRFIEKAKPGRHTDHFGLSLFVARGGSRQWHWRGTLDNRPVVISMGAALETTPDEAREQALAYRKLARAGTDPSNRRNTVPSLRDAVAAVVESKRSSWKNPDVAARRWTATTEKYAQRLVSRPVDKITPADVEAAIDLSTASGCDALTYVTAAFDRCVALGHVATNPATQARAVMAKPKRTVTHQRAIAYNDLPELLRMVGNNTATKLALHFIALTASRRNEAIAARWDEFDLEGRTWTVPASRMKGGKAHAVTLSTAALDVLRAAQAARKGEFVFSTTGAKPVSGEGVRKLVAKATSVHGLRSAFRTWAADCTDFPREVCEAALAHVTGNAVERSYNRSTYLEQRADLMQKWGIFATAGNVVSIRQTA